jgi:hypothetical protein
MDSIVKAWGYTGDNIVKGFIQVFSNAVTAKGGGLGAANAYQQILWNLYNVDERCEAQRYLVERTDPLKHKVANLLLEWTFQLSYLFLFPYS